MVKQGQKRRKLISLELILQQSLYTSPCPLRLSLSWHRPISRDQYRLVATDMVLSEEWV